MKNTYFFIILFLFYSNCMASWDPVSGKNGMVATADKFATQVGIEILQKGGNAVDAAVAVGFTLAVTYPRAGNIGGGGFMIFRDMNNDIYTIDYREKAPIAASRDMYLDENKNVIEDLSLEGYLASGVPGTVHGLFEAHKKFGLLDWKLLIEPSIELAENGFILDRNLTESLEYKYDTFIKFPSSKKVFTKNGEKFCEGDLLVQSDLANTLKLIRDNGIEGFYKGTVAALISQDMKKNNGIISEKDLAEYNSIWREPLKFTYRNHNIFSMAPPSSGGIVLAEILNTLENFNINEIGTNNSDLIHIWAEIEKQAYADRAEHLGDKDFIKIPQENLISKDYAYSLYNNVNPFHSTKSSKIGTDVIQIEESSQTTHYSIVDKWGNAVSNTYTLNGSYGSCVVIEGTGILMNNEMDDFSIKAGSANMFGLLGSEANEIAPEKRMLSSMTPTIITKNDSLHMIVGTPGGGTIITSVAQVISNVIDHHLNIRKAVEFPRFHHQWLPDEINYEKNGFSSDVLNRLKNKGNVLKSVNRLGDIQAILWNNKYKEWQGWSDPRGNGITKGIN